MVPPRVLLLFVSPGWLLSNSSEDSNGAVLRVVFACHDALRFAIVAVVAAATAPFVFACCSQDKWDESVGGTFAVAAFAFAAAINSDSDGNGTVLRAAAVAAAAVTVPTPPVCLGVADVKDEDGDSAVADAVVAATPLP